MEKLDSSRAAVEDARRHLEAAHGEALRTEGFTAVVGAVATHLGWMLSALREWGLEHEGNEVLTQMLAIALTGRGRVVAPPNSPLWGAELKSLRWGSISLESKSRVIVFVDPTDLEEAFASESEQATCFAALTRAGQIIECALLLVIQEGSLAAAVGALATRFGQLLYAMRQQGRPAMATTGLESLSRLIESGPGATARVLQ